MGGEHGSAGTAAVYCYIRPLYIYLMMAGDSRKTPPQQANSEEPVSTERKHIRHKATGNNEQKQYSHWENEQKHTQYKADRNKWAETN